MKHMIFLFFAMFLITGIFCMVTNHVDNKLTEWNNGSTNAQLEAFPTYFTLGSFGKFFVSVYPYWATIQAMFHHGTILCIFIFSIIMRRNMNRLEKNLDNSNTSPSDFSIMVMNLPSDATEKEVEDYFK
jgi:hypothetical protein